MITESVHYDDSGASELLAPELDQDLGARPRRTGLCCRTSTPAPTRSRRSRSASGCGRSRSRTRRRGTSGPKLEPVSWVESTGQGSVYSCSVHYIGPSKAYKGDPPHVVALIDLDEGVRMMSNLVCDEAPDYPSADPDDVSIGMRVRLVFHDVTDEITLPKFVPA